VGLTTAQPVPASRLTRRFLLPAVAAVLGALVTAIPWLVATLDHDQIRALEARLAGEARHAGTVLPWDRGPALDAVATALADQLAARVTVIAPDGTVLGESSGPSADLVNHADRDEVRAALATGAGHAVRWSATLDQRLLYVAWRQTSDGEARIIRISVPMSSLWEHVLRLRAPIGFGLVSALALGVFVAWLLSGAMVRRIVPRRLSHDVACRFQLPISHQMLVGGFVQGLAGAGRGLIQCLYQLGARVETLLFELAAILRCDVELVLTDLHCDPHRNRRDHVGEVSESHRPLVWLPVVLTFRRLLQRAARTIDLAVHFCT